MAVESFDASDVTSADDLKGFQTPAPGQYHLAVVKVDDSREESRYSVIVKFVVLNGTTKGQENRTFLHYFNDPNPNAKDGGAFAQKIRLAFLLSTGVITPQQLGTRFSVDWQLALNRQLKAAVINDKKDDGKLYAKIDGSNMWGPLDPDALHIPHDQVCIEAAVRNGQVNVVSHYKGNVAPGPTQTAPAHNATKPLPPAVDKYANL